MLGNVWEWCWDFLDREVYGSYRVLRGGGWGD
jgi:formylglycine-generating enzyme required for sulfatase activity